MEEEVECRRSDCDCGCLVVSACAWDGCGRSEIAVNTQEAPAKGEPRVNTDDKTVREAVFWNPSPWNNGYNCFRPFLLSSSFLSFDSTTCCWHVVVPLLLLDTRTLADMQQGLGMFAPSSYRQNNKPPA
jgi:hypothetical protein